MVRQNAGSPAEQIQQAVETAQEPARDAAQQSPGAAELDPVQLLTETVIGMARGFIERLPQIGIGIIILALTWVVAALAAKGAVKALKRAGLRPALVTLFQNLSGIIVWVIGVSIAIVVIFPSVTPAQLVAALGVGTLAIGFAFKDVFENFLAGVLILFRKEMRIGDFVECQEVEGVIESVTIRETHVRQPDGQLVIVPNSVLFTNPVWVLTDKDIRRNELTVGVDYDASLPAAAAALNKALESCESVSKSKPTEVKCVEFGGSSINFVLLWWADSTPKGQRLSFDEVAFAVKRELDAADIGIPFPQVTLSQRERLAIAEPERAE